MPGFLIPGRPGGEHDEPLLDMIIARRVLPPDAPQPMHDLARMLAALAGPAEPGELAGEAAVRAAFSRAVSPAGISAAARRPGRRRRTTRSRRPARSRARLASALVVAVAGLGSVFAAYIDVLPSPIQQLAHVTVAAPPPPSSGPPRLTTTGTRPATHAAGRSAGQAGPGSHHSTSPAQASGQVTPTPNYTPHRTRPPRRRPAEPSCGPSPGQSPSPQPKPSGYPTPTPPPWYQAGQCIATPTGPADQRTPNPYVPISGTAGG
ncbi:MAG TPA: hypothetical protein VGS06_38255 [Streptosporangiaceae bacterium]|nr:hypothetical protein [Streptosporangiaceae bacterium]